MIKTNIKRVDAFIKNYKLLEKIGAKNTNIYSILTITVVVIYGMLMLYFCIRVDALVPDEIWFYSIAVSKRNIPFIELIKTPNLLGYGSIYWITMTLLKNLLMMRLFSWGCMLVVPICIIVILIRGFNRTWKNAFIAILFFLSCPLAWFTGKIIGPELYGNALGAIGVTIILTKKDDKSFWHYLIGGWVIGLSTGLKPYNLCFGLFIGLYEILTESFYKDSILHIKIKNLFIKGVLTCTGCAVGFILANLNFLVDRRTYFLNWETDRRSMEFSYIWELLTKSGIQWDLVNSGGFTHCIMSLAGLILLMIISGMNRKSRKLSIVSFISFIVVLLLFSTYSRVLGWYYIPFLFIFPLCITDQNSYWLLLVVNLLFVRPDLWYQIDTKLAQINNIDREELIENFVEENYVGYEGYKKVYLTDFGLKNIGTTSQIYFDMQDSLKKDNMKNSYFIISERYRKLPLVDNLVLKAKRSEDGYTLIAEQNGISVLIYKE